MKKIYFLFLFIFIFILTGCNNSSALKTKEFNLNSIGINISLPENYYSEYTEYNNNNSDNKYIYKYCFKTKDNSSYISLTEYKLSTNDYIEKYYSFNMPQNLNYKKYMEEIKCKNGSISNLKYTNGNEKIKNKEIYYDMYIFDIDNKAFVLEFSSNDKFDFDTKEILENIKINYSKDTNVLKEEPINITGYSVYEISSNFYATIPTYFSKSYKSEYLLEKYNVYYTENYNEQMIILNSSHKFQNLNKNYWRFINGIEIVNISDNEIIAHDINLNENYYLVTLNGYDTEDIYTNYYEIVYLSKHNNTTVPNFTKSTLLFMNKIEYEIHKETLKNMIKKQ